MGAECGRIGISVATWAIVIEASLSHSVGIVGAPRLLVLICRARWQLPPQSGSWSLNLPADSHTLTLLLEQPLHLKAVQYTLAFNAQSYYLFANTGC